MSRKGRGTKGPGKERLNWTMRITLKHMALDRDGIARPSRRFRPRPVTLNALAARGLVAWVQAGDDAPAQARITDAGRRALSSTIEIG